MCEMQKLRASVEQILTAAAEEIFGVFQRSIAEIEEKLSDSPKHKKRNHRLPDTVHQTDIRIPREQQGRSPHVDQEDPEPPHMKEDQEEEWISQEGEQTMKLTLLSECPTLIQKLWMVKEELPLEQQDRSPSLDQVDPEPPHTKKEENLWTNQEGEQLQGLEEPYITKFPFTPPRVKSEYDEDKAQSSQLHQSQTEENTEEPEDGDYYGGSEPDSIQNNDFLISDVACQTTQHQCTEDDKTYIRIPPEQQGRSPHVDQEDPEPPHMKEDQEEEWISQEGEQTMKLTLLSECPTAIQKLWMVNNELPLEQQDRNPSLDQVDPEPPHTKEEENLWTHQEGEQLQGLEEADITKFLSTPPCVRSDYDEDKAQPSQLHQSQPEENTEEPEDGDDYGGSESDSIQNNDFPISDVASQTTQHHCPEDDKTSCSRSRQTTCFMKNNFPLPVVGFSSSKPSSNEESCHMDESSSGEASMVVSGQSDRDESQSRSLLTMSLRKSTLAASKSSKKRRKSEQNPTPSSSTQNLIPDAASDDDDTKTVNTGRLHTFQQTPTESSDQRVTTDMPNPEDTFCTLKNYCYVCKKPQTKIARHLKKHENTEPDIAAAFMLPKHSKERKRLLEKLRNKGNYEHNQDVMGSQSGALKLKRRQKRSNCKLNAQTYVHCAYCKGMFVRKELWRHMRRCPSKTVSDSDTTRKGKVLVLADIADSTFSHAISPGVWKMLGNMKEDDICSVVRNDFLILQMAQSLYNKHGTDPTKYEYIRQKVREMGRLLLSLRKNHSLLSFEDALKPHHFNKVIEAVKDVAGYDEENHKYNTPSLALKLGNSLKKIGDIILCRAIAAEDDGLIEAAERFKILCSREWAELVSHTALATLSKSRFNKPSTIPFTQDVQLLNQYLEKRSADAYNNLTKRESSRTYTDLARVTLAQIVIFNRCCTGVVSKMTLESFRKRDQSELSEHIAVGLSPFEKKMSKHFSRVEIMGKKGRKVAVLLNPELVSAVNLLVDKRDVCDVDKDNPFLFARPKCSATSYYRGQDCIRVFASLCGATNPEYLKSRHLRKHVATMSQILNLKDNELGQLANFLGHHIRVHRDYYRSPEATVEIAKISMLLLAMETGSLARFQGKSFDEIDIEGELEMTVDVNVAEISDDDEDSDPDHGEVTQAKAECSKGASRNVSGKRKIDQDEMESSAGGSKVSLAKAETSKCTSRNVTVPSRRTTIKRRWSTKEINAVMKHFKSHISKGSLATKAECKKCKVAEDPVLRARTIQNIRDFVRNRGLMSKTKS
ncbi:uncharacterized protein LOC115428010 [Sphaeramia orbicularis]|uniref:uncharacterized protein LOC115428010 n=1 Tax=Sphaeramia orbicularis TaxID=375764 RepID=UPI00117F07CC|nr:uncharacterized protein LOC115428010 [Sphaeramia orbicularis]